MTNVKRIAVIILMMAIALTGALAVTTAKTMASTKVTEADMKASVPANVMKTYEASGLKITYNKGMSALGEFRASRGITMQSKGIATFRHEMGHFVSAAKNEAADTNTFGKIYKAEKNKKSTSEYGKQSSDEYFAESFKDYLAKPGTLKSNRPQTYRYMKAIVKSVSTQDLQNKWWAAA